MQIVIDNIEQFKAFFDVVYDSVADLLELQLYPDRMVCSVLDRGRTRYFHAVYEEDFFDLYVIDDVQSITVFIDDLNKLLKSANKKDTLILELNDEYLVGKIESDTGNTRLFEFVLPSEDIDSPNPPSLELPMVLECNVDELKQTAKDINLIGSDLFTFVADGNLLTVMTSNDVPTKYASTLDVDYESSSDTVLSSFALDYINQMLKFDKICKTVKLRLGEDAPVLYSYKDDLMGVTVSGMIAPRMSEE